MRQRGARRPSRVTQPYESGHLSGRGPGDIHHRAHIGQHRETNASKSVIRLIANSSIDSLGGAIPESEPPMWHVGPGGPIPQTMNSLPLLYSFRRCPYAIRARLALLASQTVCIIREVKLSAKPVEMLFASPKATVPVLVLPCGSVIEQSLDIMRWSLLRNDPAGWLDHDGDHLIEANDGPFKHHLDRAKYPDRHGSDAAEHRAACLDMLHALEDRLATGPYLCGNAMSLPDAAILPFVRQFASIDRGWFNAQTLPHTRRWLDRLAASQLFDVAMIRLAPWRTGDPETGFP